MSRRIGAYVLFNQQAFEPEVREIIDRVNDLSPVMRPISYDALREGRDRLARGGDGDWPAPAPETIRKKRGAGLPATPGVGDGGGFVSTLRAFHGKRNAGWKTRAPHAHLFGEGTSRHVIHGRVVNLYSSNGQRLSRAESRRRVASPNRSSRFHAPPRPFAYMSDQAHARYNGMISAYVLFGRIER